ncbi:hypothetical protein D3C86_2030000 [compost metagenome]
MPAADYKADGARAVAGEIEALNGRLTMGPDLFFDGKFFDPTAVDAYIASQRQSR